MGGGVPRTQFSRVRRAVSSMARWCPLRFVANPSRSSGHYATIQVRVVLLCCRVPPLSPPHPVAAPCDCPFFLFLGRSKTPKVQSHLLFK